MSQARPFGRRGWKYAPPNGYLARAKSFAAAAAILNTHHTTDFTPYLFCCGQATELALKGLLLLNGVDEDTFKRRPGHNLAIAWRRAVKLGAPLGADPPQWCDLLNATHDAPFDSRYPRANVLMGLPAPQVVLDGINDLIDTLGAELQK